MDQLPTNIRKDLLKIIPLAVFNEVKCFDIYDKHPMDDKLIEVIVCTVRGEVMEFYKREVVKTYTLQNIQDVAEIKVIRNKNCDLFYLLQADDKIILLSRKESIRMHHEIDKVNSYTFEDTECRGRARLKIIKTDDGMPLVFDDNFEKLEEQILLPKETKSEETLPLMVQLQRKLSEAKYCVKFNEDKYKQLLELRQQAIFQMYDSRAKDLQTSLNVKDIANLLQVGASYPEVKLCNKKILIIINIANKSSIPLEDLDIILHNSLKKTMQYKTKLYEEVPHSPYWREKETRVLEPNISASVVAVVDLDELQHCVNSKLNFDVLISYVKEGKCLLLPFDKVYISANDIMGENFDILSGNCNDDKIAILCVLSSCEKETLCLKHIPTNNSKLVTLDEIFCTHLKMEQWCHGVAIHKLSPYHILHGVMVHFKQSCDNSFDVDVYARSPSQLLALTHCIYDSVPHRIVVLSKDMQMLPIDKPETEMAVDSLEDLNFEELRKSIVYQTSEIKDYFDQCLVKMNESKDPVVQAKVGREIDIAALGKEKFLEFRRKILESTEKGILGLYKINENQSQASMEF